MAAVTICSDFGAPKNKVWHCFHCFPIYFPWSDGTRCHDFRFLNVEFNPAFSLSSFTFIKRLFSPSSLSAIRVVSSAYLRIPLCYSLMGKVFVRAQSFYALLHVHHPPSTSMCSPTWKSYCSRVFISQSPAHSEKAMATHSSTLAWKIPWMEEPGRLQSTGSLGVGHNWATSLSLSTFMHWRRKWQPTPVFLPGESQGQGSLVGCHLWGCRELDMTDVT